MLQSILRKVGWIFKPRERFTGPGAVYLCAGCRRIIFAAQTVFVAGRPYHSLECWKGTIGA